MITEKAKKQLIDTVLYSINDPQDKTNPFVLDGEKAYMKYDAIRISQSDSETVSCEFLWNDTTVYTLNARGNFANGNFMTIIAGGRMDIDLQPHSL
jgi:hypothetical protein